MRRFLCMVAVLALAIPASLAEAKSKEPVNFAYGDATVVFPLYGETFHATFDVTGNPLTFAASGLYRQHVFGEGFDFDITGDVDCLRLVGGNTAYMSGIITESNRADIPVGTPFFTDVTDTSPDGSGDELGRTYLNPGFTCATILPPGFLTGFVITSGNVVVQHCDWINGSGKCKTEDEEADTP
jgi:hypothetical protein